MVYVDDFYTTGIRYGRMKMSHLVADTTNELLDMVDKIGVQRKWIQYPGTGKEHFDICLSARKKAIFNGTKEVPMRELAPIVIKRTGPNDKIIL